MAFEVRNKLFSIFRSLRYKDVLIFEAPALVGVAFSIPGITLETAIQTLLFTLAAFLLMAQIFYFNDWSDSSLDSQVAEKSEQIHLNYGVTEQELLVLSISFGILSLIVFALFSKLLFMIALSIQVLSILYSFPHPNFKGKGIPLLSSVLHIAGAVLTFLLGYSLFSPLDTRGLWIGGYFAFLLTAGHLFQEVQDYAGDQKNNVSTNAVQFGTTTSFVWGFGLLTASFAYLFGLAEAGLLPSAIKYLVLFFPVFGFMGVRALKAGLNHEGMWRFRSQYRVLFGLIVCLMVGITVMYK